jgi:tRNA (guanine-N7-)-methyltransferase
MPPTLDDFHSRTHSIGHVKSFVRREGRITTGQERAIKELWQRFGVDIASPFDPQRLFGRRAPLVLEIGFGDGEALATTCLNHPEMDFLGIEVHRPGLGHLLLRALGLELTNLRVIHCDAVEVLDGYLPDESLDRVQIFFPDPWPKLRHHKRRLIRPTFVSAITKKLKPHGQLHIATDCDSYAYSILAILTATTKLENTAVAGGFAKGPAHRPMTKFERRCKDAGRPAWEIRFAKCA